MPVSGTPPVPDSIGPSAREQLLQKKMEHTASRSGRVRQKEQEVSSDLLALYCAPAVSKKKVLVVYLTLGISNFCLCGCGLREKVCLSLVNNKSAGTSSLKKGS